MQTASSRHRIVVSAESLQDRWRKTKEERKKERQKEEMKTAESVRDRVSLHLTSRSMEEALKLLCAQERMIV